MKRISFFSLLVCFMFIFASCQKAIEETPWADYALKYKDKVFERDGDENDPMIVKAMVKVGFEADSIDDNKISWCAAWAGFLLGEAGIKPSGSALGASYQKWGVKVKPRKWAIAITTDNHIAFLYSEEIFDTNSGKSYKLLGGNQTNSFKVSYYPVDKVAQFRMPTKNELLNPANPAKGL